MSGSRSARRKSLQWLPLEPSLCNSRSTLRGNSKQALSISGTRINLFTIYIYIYIYECTQSIYLYIYIYVHKCIFNIYIYTQYTYSIYAFTAFAVYTVYTYAHTGCVVDLLSVVVDCFWLVPRTHSCKTDVFTTYRCLHI